jgi:hypothetical protein
VLIHDAHTGDPEAVQDGRVDLDRHTIFPQVIVALLVKPHCIGNDLWLIIVTKLLYDFQSFFELEMIVLVVLHIGLL